MRFLEIQWYRELGQWKQGTDKWPQRKSKYDCDAGGGGGQIKRR